MRKINSILALLTLTLGTLSAGAVNKVTVHGTSGENGGFNGGEVTKITFSPTDFTIWQGDTQAATFAVKDVVKISFGKSSGVNAVHQASIDIRGSVTTTLSITGLADDFRPTPMQIYSPAGQTCIAQSAWGGEDIDVSALPAGIYIINFNSTTLKFVKK